MCAERPDSLIARHRACNRQLRGIRQATHLGVLLMVLSFQAASASELNSKQGQALFTGTLFFTPEERIRQHDSDRAGIDTKNALGKRTDEAQKAPQQVEELLIFNGWIGDRLPHAVWVNGLPLRRQTLPVSITGVEFDTARRRLLVTMRGQTYRLQAGQCLLSNRQIVSCHQRQGRQDQKQFNSRTDG